MLLLGRGTPEPMATVTAGPVTLSVIDLQINSVKGKRAIAFKVSTDAVEIRITNSEPTKVIQGKLYKGSKRLYEVAGKGVIDEVKGTEEGFKLRTPDGKLLWKIHLYPTKLKISDNEEDKNAYVLETKDGQVNIQLDERSIGTVTRNSPGEVNAGNSDGKPSFVSHFSRLTVAPGIMLLDKIPEPEKYLIIAELLARGR